MQELTASLGDNGPDTALSDAVLVVSPNTRDRQALKICLDFVKKIKFSKDAVVGAISFDGDTTLEGKTFEIKFGADSVCGAKRDLKINFGKSGGDVNKQGATTKLISVTFAYTRAKEATSFCNLKMVDSDFITLFQLVMLKGTNGFRTSGGARQTSGTTDLFGIVTRGTLGTICVAEAEQYLCRGLKDHLRYLPCRCRWWQQRNHQQNWFRRRWQFLSNRCQ